jgi:N-acetylmuramoyl-L-alanine amidase
VKFAWLLLAMVIALLPCSHAASRQTAKSAGTSSARYVSLRKWAQQKGFTYRHDSVKNECLVSSKWTSLLFEKDNRRCLINGVAVWLSSPPTASKDTFFLTERDLTLHISPILYPAKMPKGKRLKTIVLSPGHGGKDPGFIIRDQQEKKYTLLMARELKEVLQRAGFKVIMTRDKDIYVDLEEQALMATRAHADLFVNLHFNAHVDVDAKGVEVFCLTPEGATSTNGGRTAERMPGNKNDPANVLLAYQMQKALVRDMDMLDRGVRRASFVVLKNATMPCVLVEGGFMSNPGDAKKIFDIKNRRKMAQAMTDGVLAYKKMVEK